MTLTQPNSQNFQNTQYIPPTFINPLMYQHFFNQSNPYFLPNNANNENSFHFQMQGANVLNTNANISMMNMHTNTNMNNTSNTSNTLYENCANTNTNAQLELLTIEQFLEELDKEHGAKTFTKYLDAFKEQEVDVLDIVNFKDNDWITLGIDKVGPKSKIIRALNKYNK